MKIFFPRALPACCAAVLCAGCAGTLSPAPQVDVLSTAPPVLSPQQVAGVNLPASGSLFRTSGYRPGFEDRRARQVGDVVTINIVENVTASQQSTSTIDRSNDVKAGISALPFFGAASLAAKTGIGASSENNFSGKGGTSSANTFSGAITATVVEVLPNGHLVVTGEKQIGVNQNVDVLRFSGTVDPRALQPGSIVSSSQVANVRVESRGRGAQAEAQATGWLSRVFLNVLPF
ncbi:flagellar basal body L-ring protein FlgH [Xylophilus sp.]|uniref:flagellar basal body L-ring protein FlgH n=1 Tax=Xylophilus sp. TaxID=2653893 RepID=UPI0013BE3DAC|nr:flagellar basal body L-ring protein FlgH [Xylophilus sp.]KAF1044616.1 MAG: Flagellar L-ring protein [Xylophilus sp.]